MEGKSLIFIGERTRKRKWQIVRKLAFFDAVKLSQESSLPPKTPPYQVIPLRNKGNVSIRFTDYDMQVIYRQNSLQIIFGKHELSEKEIFNILKNFGIKTGSTIKFLDIFPRGNATKTGNKKMWIFAEGKKLE